MRTKKQRKLNRWMEGMLLIVGVVLLAAAPCNGQMSPAEYDHFMADLQGDIGGWLISLHGIPGSVPAIPSIESREENAAMKAWIRNAANIARGCAKPSTPVLTSACLFWLKLTLAYADTNYSLVVATIKPSDVETVNQMLLQNIANEVGVRSRKLDERVVSAFLAGMGVRDRGVLDLSGMETEIIAKDQYAAFMSAARARVTSALEIILKEEARIFGGGIKRHEIVGRDDVLGMAISRAKMDAMDCETAIGNAGREQMLSLVAEQCLERLRLDLDYAVDAATKEERTLSADRLAKAQDLVKGDAIKLKHHIGALATLGDVSWYPEWREREIISKPF